MQARPAALALQEIKALPALLVPHLRSLALPARKELLALRGQMGLLVLRGKPEMSAQLAAPVPRAWGLLGLLARLGLKE